MKHVFKTQCLWEDITKGNRKLARTHTCLEWFSCSGSFLPAFQQMTAADDKRCWFRGQIKPWTGKIMCLWSINTDTRCAGFTLKFSGPANRPLCAFQLSNTNHFRGSRLKAALDSEYGFAWGLSPGNELTGQTCSQQANLSLGSWIDMKDFGCIFSLWWGSLAFNCSKINSGLQI